MVATGTTVDMTDQIVLYQDLPRPFFLNIIDCSPMRKGALCPTPIRDLRILSSISNLIWCRDLKI
ncbi:hypothetical protein CY34DRAFT_796940 [Suillus luteus UH-Slu-Lm8-n1]|uniref:Uncharacterized protein n=1 Tax=Suillus luteus UH-Slu-Lm8-n1 TaxID=930992 RepID=A0A0D0C407_9AGAM|nr:hypothetical protein CY34DRAFT_796940 [Suillus luteus UH-Slu-Lm8-n1]